MELLIIDYISNVNIDMEHCDRKSISLKNNDNQPQLLFGQVQNKKELDVTINDTVKSIHSVSVNFPLKFISTYSGPIKRK